MREKHRLPLYSVNFFRTFSTRFQTRTFFLCQVRSGGPAICDKIGRYSCQQCACTFVSTYVLNRHMRNIHQKLVKFRCQICGKGYDERRNYHDHIINNNNILYLDTLSREETLFKGVYIGTIIYKLRTL